MRSRPNCSPGDHPRQLKSASCELRHCLQSAECFSDMWVEAYVLATGLQPREPEHDSTKVWCDFLNRAKKRDAFKKIRSLADEFLTQNNYISIKKKAGLSLINS